MRGLLLATIVLSGSLFGGESKEKAEKWVPLFDGESLTGWTDAQGIEVKEGRWLAEGGVLIRKEKGAGDLYSSQEYEDFEFSFEWKISAEGNSGVKYRVAAFEEQFLGLEYQILDDTRHPDGKDKDRRSAALYDLKAASDAKALNPVGKWNSSRIIVREGLIQHYLNGALVVEIAIPSAEWEERFAQSKYAQNQGFGTKAKGRLMLQDHGNEVSFRELKIRVY